MVGGWLPSTESSQAEPREQQLTPDRSVRARVFLPPHKPLGLQLISGWTRELRVDSCAYDRPPRSHGDRAFKLRFRSTPEYGRYVKPLREPSGSVESFTSAKKTVTCLVSPSIADRMRRIFSTRCLGCSREGRAQVRLLLSEERRSRGRTSDHSDSAVRSSSTGPPEPAMCRTHRRRRHQAGSRAGRTGSSSRGLAPHATPRWAGPPEYTRPMASDWVERTRLAEPPSCP